MWIVVGAVALAVGGYLTAAALVSNSSDPSEVVSSYLAAIADGNASAAAQIVDPAESDIDTTYLTDDVLGAATERIEVVSVSTTEREGNTAEVEATMRLASQTFTHSFTVTRDASAYWLLQSGWHADPSPLTVDADVVVADGGSFDVEQVDLAGTEIDLAEDSSRSRTAGVQVYPAVYDVTGPDLGPYFTIKPGELVAISPAVAALWVEPTEELNTALLDAAEVRADACVKPGTSTDAACPIFIRQQDPSATGVVQAPHDLSFVNGRQFMVSVVFSYPAADGTRSSDGTSRSSTALVGKYTVDGDEVTVEFFPWD